MNIEKFNTWSAHELYRFSIGLVQTWNRKRVKGVHSEVPVPPGVRDAYAQDPATWFTNKNIRALCDPQMQAKIAREFDDWMLFTVQRSCTSRMIHGLTRSPLELLNGYSKALLYKGCQAVWNSITERKKHPNSAFWSHVAHLQAAVAGWDFIAEEDIQRCAVDAFWGSDRLTYGTHDAAIAAIAAGSFDLATELIRENIGQRF